MGGVKVIPVVIGCKGGGTGMMRGQVERIHMASGTDKICREMLRTTVTESESILKKQICPGLVETPFLPLFMGKEAVAKTSEEFKMLEAKDIADTVIYQLGLPQHAQVQDVLIRPLGQSA